VINPIFDDWWSKALKFKQFLDLVIPHRFTQTLRDREVEGSNPSAPTFDYNTYGHLRMAVLLLRIHLRPLWM
jgi:hypothetical protein